MAAAAEQVAGAAAADGVLPLPADETRRVFSALSWRDLCACACSCTAWRPLAAEERLWQAQLAAHFHRQLLLPHYAQLAAAAAAAPSVSSSCTSQAACDSKQQFAAYRVLPPAAHQALLKRFHDAMRRITGWRLLLRAASGAYSSGGAGPAAAAAPAALAGHPTPLTRAHLLAGGWCIGCVQQQRQEQSCWLRFRLPAQLKGDPQLSEDCRAGRVAAVLQALGPDGWFDAAAAEPLLLLDDDMSIHLQSHATGFYFWDQAAEEPPPDRYDDNACTPLPWDLAPGEEQQHLRQGSDGQARQAAAPATAAAVEQGHKLRLLVYVHFEQLLQMLPWRPQHPLALPPSPAAAGSAGDGGAMPPLWLHLDVCQLRGGFRVGSCVAWLHPMAARPAAAGEDGPPILHYAEDEALLVSLYSHTPANSSSGVPQQPLLPAAPAARARGEAGECQQLLLGRRAVLGAGVPGPDGLVVDCAGDALLALLAQDEVMIDFSLFDASGRLLIGRAGVEVWSQEVELLDGSLRCLHKMHFLVDGLKSSLWDCCILVGRVGFAGHALRAKIDPLALPALLQNAARLQQQLY